LHCPSCRGVEISHSPDLGAQSSLGLFLRPATTIVNLTRSTPRVGTCESCCNSGQNPPLFPCYELCNPLSAVFFYRIYRSFLFHVPTLRATMYCRRSFLYGCEITSIFLIRPYFVVISTPPDTYLTSARAEAKAFCVFVTSNRLVLAADQEIQKSRSPLVQNFCGSSPIGFHGLRVS